jgi:GGDEF domain-containing protein
VDVTERKQAELALQRDALHDPRTGLANRLLFEDRLGVALARVRRRPEEDCALVVVRVLGRGSVGGPVGTEPRGYAVVPADRVGERSLPHPAGRDGDAHGAVVRRLRELAHEGDTAARLGEDEFALLVETGTSTGTDATRTDPLADGAARRAPVPATVGDLLEDLRAALGPRVATGLVGSLRGLQDVAEVLREADIAVLRGQARAAGRRVLLR